MMNLDPVIMHSPLEDLLDFPVRDDDVFVVGFPKSGTNWLQIMLTNLWDDWGNLNGLGGKVPSLHGPELEGVGMRFFGYESAMALESPRLIKTHLHRDIFPRRWPEHGKVIQITRNPKDCCVSLYFDLKGLEKYSPDSASIPKSFDSYVQNFCSDDLTWGPFVDSVASWYHFEHPNLHKVSYESMIADTRTNVEGVIEFLGKAVDSERLDEVLEKAKFENMKKNDYRFLINHADIREGSDEPFIRRGIVGGWRDYLTISQSSLIDREIVAKLEALDIHLYYGN